MRNELISCKTPPWDTPQNPGAVVPSDKNIWLVDVTVDGGFSGVYYPKDTPLRVGVVDNIMDVEG